MDSEFRICFDHDDKELISSFTEQISTIEGLSYEKVEQSGFDGLSFVVFLISSGTVAVAIKALRNIVVEIIKKNAKRNITIGDISLTGYDKNQAIEVIDKYFDSYKRKK